MAKKNIVGTVSANHHHSTALRSKRWSHDLTWPIVASHCKLQRSLPGQDIPHLGYMVLWGRSQQRQKKSSSERNYCLRPQSIRNPRMIGVTHEMVANIHRVTFLDGPYSRWHMLTSGKGRWITFFSVLLPDQSILQEEGRAHASVVKKPLSWVAVTCGQALHDMQPALSLESDCRSDWSVNMWVCIHCT